MAKQTEKEPKVVVLYATRSGLSESSITKKGRNWKSGDVFEAEVGEFDHVPSLKKATKAQIDQANKSRKEALNKKNEKVSQDKKLLGNIAKANAKAAKEEEKRSKAKKPERRVVKL